MKKVYLFFALLASTIACTKYGEGGDNAVQYVHERMPELTKEAASVEVTMCDTIGVDNLDSLIRELEAKEIEAKAEIIRWKDLRKFAEDMEARLGWDKRLMFNVAVKAKSTKTENIGVIMEKDGKTPLILYQEYKKKFESFYEKLADDLAVLDIDDLEE